MTGYTRNDTSNNIADGNIINASDLDGEFDAIQTAFDVSTGHSHDGTVGEGAPIEVVGPTQDVVITASVIRPKTDNTVDLGTSTLEFKDLFLDGTAKVDTLTVDENASVTGTLNVTGTTTLGTLNVTTIDTTNIEVTNIKAKDGTASATIADTTGVMTVASAVLTTADINGGTIDGTTIGGSSAAAGTFTTATATTVNATTVDTTNIEVTTLKAKDGTSAGSIADSTGVVTLASSVLTTTDINGGTVDGAVIGGSSAAAITGTTITATGDVTIADKIIHAGDTNTAIRFPAADTVTVETAGAERLRVDSSGNVGIGTSSPAAKLEVSGDIISVVNGTSSVAARSGDNTDYSQLRFRQTATESRIESFAAGTGTFAPLTFHVNSAERMRITSGGDVGIGTGNPDAKLRVNGGGSSLQARFSGTNGRGLAISTFTSASTTDNGVIYNAGVFADAQHVWQCGGTERMRIDSSGNVGIGTSTANYRLNVAGPGGSGNAAIAIVDTSNSNKEYRIDQSVGQFRIIESGVAERLILSSGNLGLGVTPNTWFSSRKAIQVNTGGAFAASNAGFAEIYGNAYLNGSAQNIYSANGTAGLYQVGSGHAWFTAPSGTAGNAITFTQAMTLNASGNLGIGTTSPTQRLHVAGGNILVNSGSETTIITSGGNFTTGANTDSAILYQSGDLLFGPAPTERIRMTADGNLLVGGPVPGTQGALTIQPRYSTGSGNFVAATPLVYWNRVNSASVGTAALFQDGGNTVGSITYTNTATAYNIVSDYRLKENVQPMQDALAKIAQLNPVTYTWKADGSDGQGFIAHELQAVVPDCVSGEKDAVDAEGNPQYQGVDTSFLVATLVKAVQELTAKVASLEAQLNP
jgi:hypothetical protein